MVNKKKKGNNDIRSGKKGIKLAIIIWNRKHNDTYNLWLHRQQAFVVQRLG